jgi:hypothetical protein
MPSCVLLAVTGQLESLLDRLAEFELAEFELVLELALLEVSAVLDASEEEVVEAEVDPALVEDCEPHPRSTRTPLNVVVFISAGAPFCDPLAAVVLVSP